MKIMTEMIKRSMAGIAVGGIITFGALTILMVNQIEAPITTIWLYMLASLIMGIYYGLASFIFEREQWSPLIKTVIHFSLSISIYFMIALSLGWIPFTFIAISLTSLVFIVLYAIIWIVIQLYYKRMESHLNKNLQSRK
ncbi:MAG TPA: DUF3021 domain-containing protein [Virgibacillus sp.]|nr:DUF3021 domain-containing protein [Virgibacillus sp.]